MSSAAGEITEIIGVVVTAKFPDHATPEIYNAIEVPLDANERLVCEVQQHLGGGVVKAVAMSTTDGLRRGMTAVDTGQPIAVPVGPATLGRVFNVLGQPIDSDLPVAPHRVHLMLKYKAGWVEPDIRKGDDAYQLYPVLSIEVWHKKHGLWVD